MSNSCIEATFDNSAVHNNIFMQPVIYLVAYSLYTAPSLHLSYCIEHQLRFNGIIYAKLHNQLLPWLYYC